MVGRFQAFFWNVHPDPLGEMIQFDELYFSNEWHEHQLEEVYFGCGPFPVTVTTRIIPFLGGNPCKPSFGTVSGWGVHPKYSLIVFKQSLGCFGEEAPKVFFNNQPGCL